MARTKINVRQQQFGFPDEDLKASLHDEIVLWLKKNALDVSKKLLGWSENWDARFIESERTRLIKAVEQRKKLLESDLIKGNLWRHSGDRDSIYQRNKTTRLNEMREHLVFLNTWAGLGEPPPRQIKVSAACEVPITRERYKTTDIVGYADIIFSIRVNYLKAPFLSSDQSENPVFDNNPLNWRIFWDDAFNVALDAKTTIPSFGQIIRDLNTYREFRKWPFIVVSPEVRFAEAIADEGFGFIQYPAGIFLQPKSLRKNPNPLLSCDS